MPPTALATTALPFHIASATVSPNPSARLFWQTTDAWRCKRVGDRGILVVVGGWEKGQVDVTANDGGQRLPLDPAFREHPHGLGVVLYAIRHGSGEDQVRTEARVEALGKPGHDARHVLHPIPPRDLDDQRSVYRRRLGLPHNGCSMLDHALASVRALKPDPPCGARPMDQPGGEEHSAYLVPGQVHVLGGERIDRRRDHVDPIGVQPLGDKALAGEDEGVDLREVRPQEAPRTLCPFVRSVRSDVAPPDDRRAAPPKRRSQTGSLRVVQDDDVAWPNQSVDIAGIRAQRPFVRLSLGGTQRPAVARRPVQAIMDPLRYVEERRVSLDHEPSRRDAAAAGVAQKRLEQLGDAAADRRRVDIDHGARTQHVGGAAYRLGQLAHPRRADHGCKTGRPQWPYVYLAEGHGDPLPLPVAGERLLGVERSRRLGRCSFRPRVLGASPPPYSLRQASCGQRRFTIPLRRAEAGLELGEHAHWPSGPVRRGACLRPRSSRRRSSRPSASCSAARRTETPPAASRPRWRRSTARVRPPMPSATSSRRRIPGP